MESQKLFAALLSVFLVGALRADSDIKVVNYEEMQDMKTWAHDLVTSFEKKKEAEIGKVNDARKNRDEAIKDAQAKSSVTNEKGKEEARQKIVKLEADVQSTEKAAQYELQLSAQRLENDMDKRVLKSVKAYAEKNNHSFVCGEMPGGALRVLYYDKKSCDITKEINGALKEKYGKKEDKKNNKN
ncbi:hypothetical protein HN446_02290 [bacterium]|jgi:Skp family chaperone for outer membrane proteins|nr:hypothetical protein [bacterium]